MNIEQIDTLFLSGYNPGYRLWRAAMPERYYYDPEDPTCQLYPSVTTIIRSGSPGSVGLEKWKISEALKKGYADAGKDYANERAGLGTFLHACNARLMMGEALDLKDIQRNYAIFLTVEEDVNEDEARHRAENHFEELQKGILAFSKFCFDYKVKPIGIEVLLKANGFAGAVDILCEMTVPLKGFWGEKLVGGPNKGQPKLTQKDTVIRAVIDMKSGQNLYPDYDLQLTAYRELVNENFPDFANGPYVDAEGIERLEKLPAMIWSPKDWETEPTFNLSPRKPQEELWRLVKEQGLYRLKKSADDTQLILEGEVRLGEDPSKLIQSKSIREILKP